VLSLACDGRQHSKEGEFDPHRVPSNFPPVPSLPNAIHNSHRTAPQLVPLSEYTHSDSTPLHCPPQVPEPSQRSLSHGVSPASTGTQRPTYPLSRQLSQRASQQRGTVAAVACHAEAAAAVACHHAPSAKRQHPTERELSCPPTLLSGLLEAPDFLSQASRGSRPLSPEAPGFGVTLEVLNGSEQGQHFGPFSLTAGASVPS